MKSCLLLLLLISATGAEASRLFWLRSNEAGSLNFWNNRNLPATDNMCRPVNGQWPAMGSSAFWERCARDPDTQLLIPGTKAYWTFGSGPGSYRYWRSRVVVPAGSTPQDLCDKPGGYDSAMEPYYLYCSGVGSAKYWGLGTGLGSERYWLNGTQRTIGPQWVGVCMDPQIALDTTWCRAMREDVALQNVSMLEWQSLANPSLSCPVPKDGFGTLLELSDLAHHINSRILGQ